MKVFISWSGDLSRDVAEKLHSWLKGVINQLELFVSSKDIDKGKNWLTELLQELENTHVGIICVTQENLHSDWLLFEAGALAKHINRGKICTVLIDVDSHEIDPPLSSFQSTVFTKTDFSRLLTTLNSSIKNPLMSERNIAEQLDICWSNLDEHVKESISKSKNKQTDVQEFADELLLPFFIREINSGDTNTVFEWFDSVRKKQIVNLEGPLGFVENCLSRITGKRGAEMTLKQRSLKNNEWQKESYLELSLCEFGIGKRISEQHFDCDVVDSFPNHIRSHIYAIRALSYLCEGDDGAARICLNKAESDVIGMDSWAHYKALPTGILCFAVGDANLGEKHFHLARSVTTFSHHGYPYLSLLADFDRLFVNACIAGETDQGIKKLEEKRIREFRGHAWLLIRFAEVMRKHPRAVQALADLSSMWDNPLQPQVVKDRLKALQKRLSAGSGDPLRR